MMKKILIVDDDEVTRNLLCEVFRKEGFSVTLSESAESALRVLLQDSFSVVLTDIRMLELNGFAILNEIKKKSLRTVVILMTGFGSMEGAIEAIQHGAFDYVSKPFQISEIKALVMRALKHWETSEQSSSPFTSVGKVAAKTLIGKSPKIVEVYKTIAKAALSSSNVLISGESGTGKELVARSIHENSSRRGKPFTAVNCGALTDALMEAELFSQNRGALVEPHLGTLFFDEVADVPLALQVKLLRVLQEGELKIAETQEIKKLNLRVIAATHRNLENLVKEGKFREDLYYSLKVVTVFLPPLRERMDDLPEIVTHFVSRFASQNHKPISHISEEAMHLLRGYSWPGNIRELEYAIERAITMTRANILYPEDFPHEVVYAALEAKKVLPAAKNGGPRSLEDVEKEHIVRVLHDVKYNKTKAAEVLGIDRATLYRKTQRYGIPLDEKGMQP